MITIDFNSFGSDQNDLKDLCIEFVQNILDTPDKTTIQKEDIEDPESSYSVLLNYSMYSLDEFSFYDELMDFARENELYVIVYDHDIKKRKGYWFDEEDDWIEMEVDFSNQYPS